MKQLKFLILVFVMSFSFTQTVQANDTVPNDSLQTVEFEIGGKTVTIKGVEGDESIAELGEVFEKISTSIENVTGEEFPPKSTSGWFALLFAVGGIFTKLLSNGKEGLVIIKDIFDKFDTRTFVTGVGMVLSLVYQLYANDWDPFSINWVDWSAISFGFYGIGTIIHETFKKNTSADAA